MAKNTQKQKNKKMKLIEVVNSRQEVAMVNSIKNTHTPRNSSTHAAQKHTWSLHTLVTRP